MVTRSWRLWCVLLVWPLTTGSQEHPPPCESGYVEGPPSGSFLRRMYRLTFPVVPEPGVYGYGSTAEQANNAACDQAVPLILAAAQAQATANGGSPSSGTWYSNARKNPSNSPWTAVCPILVDQLNNGNYFTVQQYSMTIESSNPTSSCTLDPGPSECNTAYVGTKLSSIVSVGTEFPASICDPASNCAGTIDWASQVETGGQRGVLYNIGGESCEVGSGQGELPGVPGDATNPADAETCVGVGTEYCMSQSGSNCGYLNNQWVCLNRTKENACQVLGDGSRVCGPSATPPAVPDNGTRGQPAAPDATVTRQPAGGTSYTYNYFSAATVAGSSGAPTADGSNPGSSSGSTAGYGQPGEGEEEGEGGPCTGSDCFSGGELEEQASFEDSTKSYYETLMAAPILAAVSGLSGSVPGGSCPSWSFQVFGQSMSISPGCEIANQVLGILQICFMAGWCLVGVKIVISA